MAYLVGTDEAGYAPNLGPLVISATVWQVPTSAVDQCLYQSLRRFVRAKPPAANAASARSARQRRITIGDSKLLYRPSEGIGLLERGVLAALRATGVHAHRWRDVWEVLDPQSRGELDSQPWYRGFDGPAPSTVKAEDLQRDQQLLKRGLEQAGVRCHLLRARAVFPRQFNEAVDHYGSKGEALSQLTLKLVQEVVEDLEDERIVVHCDKHGGRNQYTRVLQQLFPEHLIEVRRESRSRSSYASGPPQRRMEFHFTAHGETSMPAALASMISKYLRELAVQAFNHFWRCHLPDLKPTAGYPSDSRRFKADIEHVQRQLGIDDDILWRKR